MTSTPRLHPDARAPRRVPRAGATAPGTFHTPVRGHAFAARPAGGAALEPDARIRLEREPANPRDPLAVAVWVGDRRPWRVGYLDRAVAARLAPRLDDGERFAASLTGWVDAPDAAWRRPLVRIVPVDRLLDAPAGPAADVPRTGLAARPPGVRRRTVGPAR